MTNNELTAELAALADHLSGRRAAILSAWSAAVRRDPNVTTPATLSRSQFYDHIPRMLDALEQKLRANRIRESLEAHQGQKDEAAGHGLQRWLQGYNEGEVMCEWISFNACLADEFDNYSAAHQLDPRVMPIAWRMFSEFTIAGMSESVSQYSRLQKTEAAGRVKSLEEAVQRLHEVESQRATLWREATHDLRGNLGVVRNVAQVLQRTSPEDGATAGALRLLGRSVGSLHALLEDLTMQARLDAGQEGRNIQPFDASVLLNELCAACQLAASERGLFLHADGPPHLRVDGDEVKIRRIAQNLLLNALTYTKEGGITVAWETLDGPPLRWAMSVQDTGPGLHADASMPLAAAIEAGTRDGQAASAQSGAPADPPIANAAPPMAAPAPSPAPSRANSSAQPHGEGVGLSIVKRLCELLDAGLEMQTSPGQGTTFRVTFPMSYPKG